MLVEGLRSCHPPRTHIDGIILQAGGRIQR